MKRQKIERYWLRRDGKFEKRKGNFRFNSKQGPVREQLTKEKLQDLYYFKKNPYQILLKNITAQTGQLIIL